MLTISEYLEFVEMAGGERKLKDLKLFEGYQTIKKASNNFTSQPNLSRFYKKPENAQLIDKHIKALESILKKTKSVSKNIHSAYSDDLRIIRGFLLLVSSVAEQSRILRFYKRIAQLNTEKRFEASPYKPELRQIVNALKETLIKGYKRVYVDESVLNRLEKIRDKFKISQGVLVIRRFYKLVGAKPSIRKVKLLLAEIRKVSFSDANRSYIQQIKNVCESYLKGSIKKIQVDQPTINGLAGVLKRQGFNMKFNKKGESTPLDLFNFPFAQSPKEKPTKSENAALKNQTQNPKNNFGGLGNLFEGQQVSNHLTFTLDGDMGLWLGKMERYKNTIIIHGEKYSGKTFLLYDLLDAFARQPWVKNIAHFSLEEGSPSMLVDERKAKYFSPLAHQKVKTAGTTPDKLETLKTAAQYFDVVAVDSFSVLNISQQGIESLRSEYPEVIFIIVIQSNAKGGVRGGKSAEYNCAVEIKTEVSPKGWQHNYARTLKNRYFRGEKMQFYNFHTRKVFAPV